jgi:hypothetical protein
MRRLVLMLAAALFLAPAAGCFHHNMPRGNDYCGCGGCGGLIGGLWRGRVAEGFHETRGWRRQRPQMAPQGPPTGTYGYPYYTTRGPRDYLASDPPGLGN